MSPKKKKRRVTEEAPFAVGDKVFARVRGYSAWPARIEESRGTKGSPRYKVFFYGTYQSGDMKKDEMWPFNEETKAKFGELTCAVSI